jgi:hypothetical protein
MPDPKEMTVKDLEERKYQKLVFVLTMPFEL